MQRQLEPQPIVALKCWLLASDLSVALINLCHSREGGNPGVIKTMKKTIPLILFSTTAVAATPAHFNKIDVSGPFQVTIKQASKNTFKANNPAAVASQVSNGVLTIWPKVNKQGQVTPSKITISLPNLSNLVIAGGASVTTRQVNFPAISVIDESKAPVKLFGHYGLQHLIAANGANIRVGWVDSKHLVVHGVGNSAIDLAGVANTMYASLYNSAQLNAQYLRVKTLNAKTYGTSVAKVTPLNMLNAFAYDRSSIFYYKYPHTTNRVTNIEGHVLQMDWRK